MAQDEQFVSSSNSAGSGGDGGGSAVTSSHNRSKNSKQKKAPQRGLGVAQLERLRLEEQRNRAPGPANALPNNAIGPAHAPVSPPANSNLAPLPLFRSFVGPSAPNDETGLRGVSSWPRLWGVEYNDHHNYLENEKQRVDYHHHHHHHNVEFAFGPQINLTMQHETNSPVSPFSGGGGNVPHWSFQFQRPPSSSVTNVSGISQSSLSSSQMEPPSIQSVRGNNYSPSWPEDEKIAVGMKRAYPFNLESPPRPTPSFLTNFHASGSRSDEFASSSNEPRNKYIRDGRLSSTSGPKLTPVGETRLFGDLLTLAPPVAATPPCSKNKHTLDYFDHQGLDLSDNRSLSSQETMRSSQTHREGPSTSTEQPFSFFPIKPQAEKTSTHARNGNGEKGEKLDLNLKL